MKRLYLIPSGMIVETLKRGAVLLLAIIFFPAAIAVAEPINGIGANKTFDPSLAMEAGAEVPKEGRTIWVAVTGYSSTVDQTDSTPCITASGYNLCEADTENILATNILPLGTRVKIPGLFGDKVFTVEDRMNRRYTNRADVWFKNRQSALNFGIKQAELLVLPA